MKRSNSGDIRTHWFPGSILQSHHALKKSKSSWERGSPEIS